jgi:hypothetical protein
MAATHTYLDELVHIIEISDPYEGLSEEFYERIRNATLLRALSCRVEVRRITVHLTAGVAAKT